MSKQVPRARVVALVSPETKTRILESLAPFETYSGFVRDALRAELERREIATSNLKET